MRMPMLVILVLSLVTLPLAMPATVRAGADVATEIVKNGTDTSPFVDPCTGATSTVTTTFTSVFHEVQRPNGTFMTISKVEGTFVSVPDDSSLPTVTGHFVSDFTLAGGANDVISSRLNATGVEEDGDRFVLRFLEHLTESATGHLVQFQKGCD
jgi:hypothetical protein